MNPNPWETKRILIVVKTYPSPSTKYQETVCTAGVTEAGEWIRIYPVRYRYLSDDQQYKKYTWIELRVRRRDKDHRVESYEPDPDSIKRVAYVGTDDRWAERKRILLPLAKRSLEELQRLHDSANISLGLFKPLKVEDFYWRPESPDWSPREKSILNQLQMFVQSPKPLEKIPYSFHYSFKCDDAECRGHNLTIIDWEICQAFREWRKRYPSVDITLQKIREKWFEQMFGPKRDSYFIVGTHFRYQTFIILGVFWPPKS